MEKKYKVLHCSNVTSILTKDMVRFYLLVDDGKNDNDHGKVTEGI